MLLPAISPTNVCLISNFEFHRTTFSAHGMDSYRLELLLKQLGYRKIRSPKDMKFKKFKMETRDHYRSYPIKLREN
jgi:hypothetical protein